MTPEIVVQKAIRSRLVANTAVTNAVPATNILDRNARPAPDPSIIVGEAMGRDEGTDLQRRLTRVYSDLHVWKREESTAGAKLISGLIRHAIRSARLDLDSGFHCVDCLVSAVRVMRDPDGETSHGVVTIETLVQEV